eukprot:1180831-Prorocentrum_minimum.AAC.3
MDPRVRLVDSLFNRYTGRDFANADPHRPACALFGRPLGTQSRRDMLRAPTGAEWRFCRHAAEVIAPAQRAHGPPECNPRMDIRMLNRTSA